MMPKDKDQNSSFHVVDKRQFNPDGERRPEAPEPPPEKPPDVSAPSTEEPFPPASFTLLVWQLATTASVLLGDLPDPSTGQATTNLPGARHYIDLLGVLEEKTSGRLDRDEENLLKGVLLDLRLKFVEKSKSGKSVQ